ncbi:MAG: hypothetical protein OXT67_13870 [Zetaproteobacteria bacterium]|nr:hypothetical protein [Zetaproteobacteria bacterium]
MRNLVFWGLLYYVCGLAQANFLQEPASLGQLGMTHVQNQVTMRAWTDTYVGEAETSFSTDQVYLERRYGMLVDSSVSSSLTQSVGIRLQGFGRAQNSRGRDRDDPSPLVQDSSSKYARVGVDLTYTTPKGLELMIGRQLDLYLSQLDRAFSPAGAVRYRYEPSQVSSLRFGLVRRDLDWGVSLYYHQGKQESRGFSQSVIAQDGTLLDPTTGTSHAFVPPKFGVLGYYVLAGGRFEVDLSSIRASEGGEKTPSGRTVHDDYFQIQTSYSYASVMRLLFAYRSLSYAGQANANIDNMPLAAVGFLLGSGEAGRETSVGVIYRYGRDGTDIQEAKVRAVNQMLSLILTAGF